jgi:hypothetical protein
MLDISLMRRRGTHTIPAILSHDGILRWRCLKCQVPLPDRERVILMTRGFQFPQLRILLSSTLNMKTERFSETTERIYNTAWCHIPD